MTHSHDTSPRGSAPGHPTAARQLHLTVAFALARGAAHATGAGIIGLLFWWITHH